ncbi:uncharacterized protein BP5553_02885 [Venustampulla echinocandica]|uniref:Major facilitator superfamily (MFS) profile domain-containing protein n=1 Tax=Venustampulla echinocandica TaxID=2656787 RepID=A0A370TSN3_9HELO|nr:uncharacterized protein BP5553_02885 [Venustampulla echinocandica]RDL38545.1 hypothetical protein BP5553_02885 [Venustampulla echinocandica]
MGIVWSYQRYQRYRREKKAQEPWGLASHDTEGERTEGIELKSHKTKNKSCPHRQQAPLLSGSDPPGQQTEGPTHASQGSPSELRTTPSPGDECQICRQDRLDARRYRFKLIIGLFLPFALQALDLTIIASALPWIASDFNQFSQMNWLIASFNLTSATFIPFWGSMADIFGRMAVLETVLLLMMVGSALCTAAPLNAFPVLILGRAFQGLSAAGITVVVRIILSDKVSLGENAKNTSTFSMVAGLSYAVGPVVGGYLTSHNWRWCFGINLPIAFVAIVSVFLLLRGQLMGPQPLPGVPDQETPWEVSSKQQRFKARISMIDFGGQFLFLVGMALVVLALTWGGVTYSWQSGQVIIPLVVGSLLVLCFIYWEYLMAPGRYLARKFPLQRPTIPWILITQRNVGLLFYIDVATGMAMTSVLYFVDIYFTMAKGYTASQAGVQLLFYTPGLGVGVYSAMYMCNVYPRQTFTPLFLGSVIEAVGVTVLTWALHQGHIPTIYGMMALTGAGTGLRFMPGTLHGIGFFPNHIASVISVFAFAVPFGGAVGMTIMGTVFNNKFSPSSLLAPDSASNSTGSGIDSNYIEAIARLSPDIQDFVRGKARDGVVWAFIALLPMVWVCVIAALFLGNVNITKQKRDEDEKGEVDWSENTYEGVFLLGVLRGRTGTKRVKKGIENGEANANRVTVQD